MQALNKIKYKIVLDFVFGVDYTFITKRRTKMADVNINFEIDEKYKDKIKTLAEKNYRSMGAQIRLILETYLDNNK